VSDVVHIGRQGFFSGKVKTKCGLTFPSDGQKYEGFFAKVTCRACKSAK
jgi:hypothetical protein